MKIQEVINNTAGYLIMFDVRLIIIYVNVYIYIQSIQKGCYSKIISTKY